MRLRTWSCVFVGWVIDSRNNVSKVVLLSLCLFSFLLGLVIVNWIILVVIWFVSLVICGHGGG